MTPNEQTAYPAPTKTEAALSPGAAFIRERVQLLDQCVRERRRGWLYSVFCGLVEVGLTEQEAGHVLAAVLVAPTRKEVCEL
jgi:hypothetical protein